MDIKNYHREERFYFSLCPVTFTSDNLTPCPDCNSVCYSDASAANSHLPTHQPMCRLLAKLSKLSSHKSVFHKNPGACLQLAALAKLAFKRNLTQFELDQLIFPRVCGVCYVADDSLMTCSACGCVAYCSKDHQELDETHHLECKLLGQDRQDYVFWQKADQSVWPEVLEKLNNLDTLPELTDMETFIDFILNRGGFGEGRAASSSEGRALSSVLSSPLTCALVIQETRTAKEEFTIHLVGSRRMEVAYLKAWLLILILFPEIKILRLILVGPESPKLESASYSLPTANTLLLESVSPCLYEEYAVSEDFKEPDLVAALNCGFILYKTWAASLPHMLRTTGAPLVFTEYYYQDCVDNLGEVKATLDVVIMKDVEKNKMATLEASRSPTAMWGVAARSLHRGRVIVDNGHMAIVRRA